MSEPLSKMNFPLLLQPPKGKITPQLFLSKIKEQNPYIPASVIIGPNEFDVFFKIPTQVEDELIFNAAYSQALSIQAEILKISLKEVDTTDNIFEQRLNTWFAINTVANLTYVKNEESGEYEKIFHSADELRKGLHDFEIALMYKEIKEQTSFYNPAIQHMSKKEIEDWSAWFKEASEDKKLLFLSRVMNGDLEWGMSGFLTSLANMLYQLIPPKS